MAPERPYILLVDANAWAILGTCREAAERAGWSPRRIQAFLDEATAGNYNHLLQTVLDHFKVGGPP